MKLFIAIPSNRGWSPYFGESIIGLIKRLGVLGIEFEYSCLIGASCLPRARSKAVSMARACGASHLLCLDDDMAFPDTLFERLERHKKSVVVVNCPTKTVWDARANTLGLDGKLLSSEGKTGIEKIKCSGLALALINMEAIKSLGDPMFSVLWSGTDYLGEDYFFFLRLQELGIEGFVDHDLAKEIAHCGEYAFHFNK